MEPYEKFDAVVGIYFELDTFSGSSHSGVLKKVYIVYYVILSILIPLNIHIIY